MKEVLRGRGTLGNSNEKTAKLKGGNRESGLKRGIGRTRAGGKLRWAIGAVGGNFFPTLGSNSNKAMDLWGETGGVLKLKQGTCQ